MHDYFLFVGLPYIALFSLIVGVIYRFNSDKYSISSLSSQFLEKEKLLWGSVPWHIGIIVILLGHIVAFTMPSFLHALVSNVRILYTFEAIGLTFALFALCGLVILFIRRLRNARIQAVTSNMDLVVLSLLTIQILLGILTSTLFRWGASWSTHTLAPYIQSIFLFRPDITYVTSMPLIVKLHIANAWLIILLIPFSRLVHIFALPLEYLFRLPQIVVWNSRKQEEAVIVAQAEAESRRYFLKALIGITGGLILLVTGIADKVIPFFRGAELTKKEKEELLNNKLEKMKAAIKQKELESERLTKDFIYVADLKDLKTDEGMYFTDYQMKPALAFKGNNGLPVLYSAKCTHLGCTIINKVKDGKLLCPCHISHFDIKTGNVIDGPAPKPLPQIKYILMDSNTQIVTNIDTTKLNEYKVYIVKGENT
ncbi:MAG: respiratory nitrate reductase subunit gamma [Candidatus Melainabacteria bacterium RIFCSPLOWO2_02_FULL_35_15]|nr:MAG: respiratory nitrate reductase subunit gamma [Candidatus Melainabacteria bacterium RIFCSPLOWO2_12_FULL_35_11]OGI13827.1 MAG: respiratory nitrate reductase subunit gamma [Candidatus Melainabacteria bacterium RIFCSPLOWO2_02_FULL_35_15]